MGWFFETPVLPSLSLKRVMSGCDCCGAKFLAALHHGKTSGRASFLLKRSSRACNSRPRFPCSWRGETVLGRKLYHKPINYITLHLRTANQIPFLCLDLPLLIFFAPGLMPSNAFTCFAPSWECGAGASQSNLVTCLVGKRKTMTDITEWKPCKPLQINIRSSLIMSRILSIHLSSACSRAKRSDAIWVRSSSMSKACSIQGPGPSTGHIFWDTKTGHVLGTVQLLQESHHVAPNPSKSRLERMG